MTHNPLEAETDTPWVGRLDFRILGVNYDPETNLCRLFLGQPEQAERNLDPLHSGEVILLSSEQEWAQHIAVVESVGEQMVAFFEKDLFAKPGVPFGIHAYVNSDDAYHWTWMNRPEQKIICNECVWGVPLPFQWLDIRP